MKPLSTAVTILLIAASVAIFPRDAFAVWGAGDVSFDPAVNGISAAQLSQDGLQSAQQIMGILKTYGLDQVAYQVAQKLSQKLVGSVLNAVNGGASQNKPQNFITNFPNYFQSIAGQATSTYLNKINATNNPFLRSVSTNISNQSAYGGSSDLSQFNLDKILTNGASWQSAAGDLRNAGNQGWDFYNQLALPGNTPIGSTIAAKEELSRQIAYQNEIAKIQLTSPGYKPQTDNKGFGLDLLSSLTNINSGQLVNASSKLAVKGITQAYYNSIADEQQKALDKLSSGNFETDQVTLNKKQDAAYTQASINYDNCMEDHGKDCGFEPQREDYSASKDVGATIQSPTSTNESNVNNATQESAKRLQNADEFFKLLFGTLTQLATGLIEKGIASLKSDAGAQSKYTYGSPADAAKALAGTNGQKGSWLASPEQIIDFRNELDAATQKTSLDVQFIQDQTDLVKQPVVGKTLNSQQIKANADPNSGTENVLEKLEICIPGPDTGWEERLGQYVEDQLKATINRGSQDSDTGDYNSKAQRLIERLTQVAVQEETERTQNPFLNIPAARELRSIVETYYPTAKKFQAMFTLLLAKRQTAAQLSNIVAQVKALRPDLILFDDQWDTMPNSKRDTLYESLKGDMVNDLSGADYMTINENGDTVLKPLPVATSSGSPTDTVDKYKEMKRRILDEEWYKWENDKVTITDAMRQNLYRQFVAVKQNITDSKSLQDSQNKRDAIRQQNIEIADAYHDCQLIRDAVANYQSYDDAAWKTFKQSLLLESVRGAFLPDSSIIAVAKGTSGIDFSKEGMITLQLDQDQIPRPDGLYNAPLIGIGSTKPYLYPTKVSVDDINHLQVQPTVPLQAGADGNPVGVPGNVISRFLEEDNDQTLFCRLPQYFLNYWMPEKLTGVPIGCFPVRVDGGAVNGNPAKYTKTAKPNWYRTSRAEIYYNLTDGGFQ